MKKRIIIIAIIIVILIIIGYLVINKINIDQRQYKIEEISEYKYHILKTNNKYGVIDNSGKKIIDATYDKIEIPNPSKEVFVCYSGEKGIAIDINNKQIYTEYNSIQAIELTNGTANWPYEKSLLKCEKNGKYGLINLSGKKILNTEYDKISDFSNIEGQLQIEKNGKIGVVNLKGTILVKPEYDSISSDNYYDEKIKYQQSGYIVGQKNQDGYKYGYINSEGKRVLKLEYNDISRITDVSYKDGVYLIAAKNGQYGVIKNNKNIIKNEYQEIEYDETNDVLILQKGKLYGAADITGKIIIPVQNTNIKAKGEYLYIERNNVKDVYDALGNKAKVDYNESIMPTANENYKISITSQEDNNYYGVKDASGKLIIKQEYRYIEYAFDNYFIVCDQDGKQGVLDNNGQTIIELKYDLVQKVNGKNMIQTLSKETNTTELYASNMKKICEMENANVDNESKYVKIYSNTKLNYYTNDGRLIQSTELFPNNNLYATVKDGKWGYTNKSGDIIINLEYEFATELNDKGYASIKKDGKWGCIDSNGKIIIEPKYELDNNYSKVNFIDKYIKIDNEFGYEYYTDDISQ